MNIRAAILAFVFAVLVPSTFLHVLADDYSEAKKLYFEGRLDDAQKMANSVLDKDPRDASAIALLGFISMDKGELESALSFANRAIACDPNKITGYLCRGKYYYVTEQYAKSCRDFQKAVDIDPSFHSGYKGLGISEYCCQRYKDAILHLTKATELNKSDFQVYAFRSLSYTMTQDSDNALKDATTALQLETNDALSYYSRGCAYLCARQFEKALQDYDIVETKGSTTYGLFYYRGLAKYGLKRYEEAVADFKRALAAKPEKTEALWQKAVAEMKMGDADAALHDLNAGIELHPSWTAAYVLRVDAYFALRQYDTVLGELDRIETLDASYKTWAKFQRGQAHLRKKEFPEALDALARVLEDRNDVDLAYALRGQIYERHEDTVQALNEYDNGLKSNPYSPSCSYFRGSLYFGQQRFEEAAKDLATAFARMPDEHELLLFEAYSWDQSGDHKKAMKRFETYLSLENSDALAFFLYACACSESGAIDDAIKGYSKAISLDPKFYEAYLNRAGLYRLLGSTKQAESDEEKAKEHIENKRPSAISFPRKPLKALNQILLSDEETLRKIIPAKAIKTSPF
jgi:tetratricopeptide (TPR) repeat protein